MKKLWAICLLAMALLAVSAQPSLAWRGGHGGTRVFIGVGGYYGGFYPYPYPYPYYYYPPYYVYTPPAVVVQQPPVYVQQQQQQPAAAAPAPTQSATPTEGYWYYCQSAGDYYPKVASCPEAWLKVAPRSE